MLHLLYAKAMRELYGSFVRHLPPAFMQLSYTEYNAKECQGIGYSLTEIQHMCTRRQNCAFYLSKYLVQKHKFGEVRLLKLLVTRGTAQKATG